MKIVFVLFSVFGLSFAALDIPEHLRAPIKLIRQACIAETGVEEKYIDQSKNGYLADVPELRCYIKCFLDHAGMIEEDGRINFSDVWHLLTPSMKETVETVVKECETIHGDTQCDTSFLTIQCYFRIAPENAELP